MEMALLNNASLDSIDKIVITHFVNPQLFWYANVKCLEENVEQLQQLEIELKLFYKQSNAEAAELKEFKNESKILLEFLPMKKLIRAVVLQRKDPVAKEIKTIATYIVWAMDYGFPIETSVAYMKPLPKHLHFNLGHIRRGAVGFLLPSNDDLWSNEACKHFNTLLSQAQELRFGTIFQTKSGQDFGHLYLSLANGVSTAAELLMIHKYAKICLSDFKSICTDLRATKICAWQYANVFINNSNCITNASMEVVNNLIKNADRNGAREIPNNAASTSVNVETKTMHNSNVSNLEPKMKTDDKSEAIKNEKLNDKFRSHRDYPVQNGYTKLRQMIMNLKSPDEQFDRLDRILKLQQEDDFFQDVANLSTLKNESCKNGKSAETVSKTNISALKSEMILNKTQEKAGVGNGSVEEKYDKRTFEEIVRHNEIQPQQQRPKPVNMQEPKKKDDSALYDKQKKTKFTKLMQNSDMSDGNPYFKFTLKKCGKPKKVPAITFPISRLEEHECINKIQLSTTTTTKNIETAADNAAVVENSTEEIVIMEQIIPNSNLKEVAQNKKNTVPNLNTTNYASLSSNKQNPIQIVQEVEKNVSTEEMLKNVVNNDDVPAAAAASTICKTLYKKKKPQTNLSKNSEIPFQENFSDHTVLAHSTVAQKPIAHITEVDFAPCVIKTMKSKNIQSVYRTQSYAWPHTMQRRQSLFVINGPRSGRTWCYLPTLCTHVYRAMELRFNQAPKNGPIAIILVSSVRHAEYVAQACRLLLDDNLNINMERVVSAYAGRNNDDVRIQLHNGCGILVATPPQLALLLKHNELEKMFMPDTLEHIVIDDLNLILQAHNKNESFALIVQLFKVCGLRKQQKLGAQIIVTTQYWDKYFMPHLICFAYAPLLLFGDFLEAATYANVDMSISLIRTEDKMSKICDFLAARDYFERTVVFCVRDDDILHVKDALELAGYNCLTFLQNANSEMRENIEHWKKMDSSKILICSDKCPELQVQNAKHLIHYSLPASWSKFTMRHSVMGKHFPNALAADANRKDKNANDVEASLKVLLLLDEHNNNQLPRLVSFLEEHHQVVSSYIVELARNIKRNFDKNSYQTMCTELLTYGVCDNSKCTARHVFNEKDKVPEEELNETPAFGDIRLFLLKVYTPCHFAARLLAHRTHDSNDWHILPHQTRFVRMSSQLNMHFAESGNRHIHWPPALNDVCILNVGDDYQRVRIINLPQIKEKHIVQLRLLVDVKFLDTSTETCECKAINLLQCPEQFKDLPAMAIDVRLLGIVPYDKDRTWISSVTKEVELKLQESVKGKQVLGQIDFSLAHTIFIKNLFVLEYMPALKINAYYVNLKKFLNDKKLGTVDKNVIEKLHALVRGIIETEEYDEFFELTNSSSSYSKSTDTLNESFVSMDDFNEEWCQFNDMHISNKLERCDSFVSVLTHFENEESVDVLSEKSHAAEAYVCKKFDNEQNELNNATDSDWDNEVDELQDTNDEFISKQIDETLTKQTEETWCRLPLHKPIQIDFGSENQNGAWDGFYIICLTEQHILDYEMLQSLINTYIQEQKPSPLTNFENFKMGDNFILEHNADFLRTKLLSSTTKYLKFLLVDWGYIINIPIEEFTQNRKIFNCTKKIIDALPFQSIYCRLANINLLPNKPLVKVTGHYFYAVAKYEMNGAFCDINKNIGIRNYEILIYESDKQLDDPEKQGVLINERLIEMGAATAKDIENNYTAEELINRLKITDVGDENEIGFHNFFKDLMLQAPNQLQGEEETNAKQIEIMPQTAVATHNQVDNNTNTNNNKSALKLSYANRFPQVTWYQDDRFIYLKISAAENTNYTIYSGQKLFYYYTQTPHDEPTESFHLNLRANISAMSHVKRGLNIYVKLLKKNKVYWCSLLAPTPNQMVGSRVYKLHWLKYNIDHILPPAPCQLNDPSTRMECIEENSSDSETEDDQSDEHFTKDEYFDYDDANEYPIYE